MLGSVVGEAEVGGTASVVGVEGTDVKVFCPLHAAMNNTNKRMKRFISQLSFTSVDSASTISSEVSSRLLSNAF